MDSSLNFKIFHIFPKENLSTTNKNKGLGFAEFSGVSVSLLSPVQTKQVPKYPEPNICIRQK